MELDQLVEQPLETLVRQEPCVAEFLTSVGLNRVPFRGRVGDWLAALSDEDVSDAGMEREQMLAHMGRLIDQVAALARQAERWEAVAELTLIGGRDKQGRPEERRLTVKAGDVVCIVGPTGSGKSRLLGDIECLAQGDTPTGRAILINGQPPTPEARFSLDRKLVAQLSQNMNFVVDLKVQDFITMHARCRMVPEPEALAARVIDCANQLTGEKFSPRVSVTQLSGGQTRALMIADVALLSASPIVLIDEIENAGVDRKRALELLVTGEKIVFISTHDPLLALRGKQRIVIRNGGIADILTTSPEERKNLVRIERLDEIMMGVRDRLRRGLRIEETTLWPV